MRFSTAFLQKFSGTDTPGYMVALWLDSESKNKIKELQKSLNLPKQAELQPLKETHCTLRYWKYDEFNDIEKLKPVLNENINYNSLITCNTFGFEIFGKEKDTLVLTIKNNTIDFLQREVDKLLQNLGIPPSDYKVFKPHVTLGFGIKEVPDVTFNLKTINFDSIKLTDNEDKILWEKHVSS